MSEREKLIKLLDQNCGYIEEQKAETLADYLLKNGVIVSPCRLNAHIFVVPTVENSLNEITEMVVLGFSIGKPCNTANCRVSGTSVSFFPAFEQFGESVFLTKEEALKALKGVPNNE